MKSISKILKQALRKSAQELVKKEKKINWLEEINFIARKNEFNDDNTATFTVGTTDDSRNVWFVNPQNSNVTSNAATPAGDAPASGSSSSL